eukprot:3297553-Pyramimonas_sp.AAC.1
MQAQLDEVKPLVDPPPPAVDAADVPVSRTCRGDRAAAGEGGGGQAGAPADMEGGESEDLFEAFRSAGVNVEKRA